MESNPWHVDSLEAFYFLCCPECGFKSKEQDFFKNHALQNHPLSQELFQDLFTPEIKLEVETDDPPYLPSTEISEETSSKKKKVRKNDSKIWKCEKCPKVLTTRSGLFWHKKQYHSAESSLMDIPKDKGGNVICSTCEETLPFDKYIMHHKRVHGKLPPEFPDDKKHFCDKCSEEFVSHNTLLNHIKKMHDKPSYVNLQRDEDGKVKCSKCQESVVPHRYTSHWQGKHGELPPECPGAAKYICEQCSKAYATLSGLQRHIKIHQEPKVFHCIECSNMEFRTMSSYVLHYRHTHKCLPSEFDETKVICDLCGIEFPNDTSLKDHMKVRHNPKHPKVIRKKQGPEKCKHCDRVFKNRINLTDHVAEVHEKSARFKCDLCPLAFVRVGKLNDHKRIVHAKVKCDICGLVIYNRYYLGRHKAEKHGIVPEGSFQCKECSVMFKTKSGLQKHLDQRH